MRWESGSSPHGALDELASEEPLEIRVDNHPVSVTMRTPGDDADLAVGFLVSEGLIQKRADLLKIGFHPGNPNQNVINIFLGRDVVLDRKRLTRHVFASSSCGLCGKATIAAIHQRFPKIQGRFSIDARLLLDLPRLLRESQAAFGRTGGLHAAGVFDENGQLIVVREDVGRHNAVDKVLGHAFLKGIWPLNRHVLLVSGRASFEILQKALAARLAIVAAVSAPSSLAVEFARKSGQTLVGFLRGEKMNIYAQAERLHFLPGK